MTLLIAGGLRLPAVALDHGTIALRLRVARRIVRIDLHVGSRIRRPVRVILALHVGLAGDVRRRRQGRLAAGRVRAVHAVAVDLAGGCTAVRRQGPLHLRREAARETDVISFCPGYHVHELLPEQVLNSVHVLQFCFFRKKSPRRGFETGATKIAEDRRRLKIRGNPID